MSDFFQAAWESNSVADKFALQKENHYLLAEVRSLKQDVKLLKRALLPVGLCGVITTWGFVGIVYGWIEVGA